MVLNVFAVLTAPPFKLLPRWHFAVYFLISVFVTYRFLYNYKAYSINEFEDLYANLKKKTNIQLEQMKNKKCHDPHRYYQSIIIYLSEAYPGVQFEYKMQRHFSDSQTYLEKQQQPNHHFYKASKKVCKNLWRTLLFWRYPSATESFVRASDEQYLKSVKAECW
jgi:hypothetical protein